MIKRSGRSAAIIAAVLVAGGSLGTGIASASTATSSHDYITFYGYTDNNPPGRAITHGCLHDQAGGTGTYADPVTYAQGDDNGPWCQRIYVPFLKKYFIHEDSECGDECTPSSKQHVDLWMGGDANSTHDPEKTALLDCEDQWTTHDTVVLNPPETEPVDTTPMFTPPTTCHGGTGD
ncbi:MAG TPA: hypothetical protein VGN81_25810 [Pseudonocardiaceae bacterium]